jgi:hypothetical protein
MEGRRRREGSKNYLNEDQEIATSRTSSGGRNTTLNVWIAHIIELEKKSIYSHLPHARTTTDLRPTAMQTHQVSEFVQSNVPATVINFGM